MGEVWAFLRTAFVFFQEPFSEEWDEFLRAEIPNGVKRLDDYYVEIGGLSVWVENYPYAFGRPSDGPRVRPSRETIILLGQIINSRRTRKKPREEAVRNHIAKAHPKDTR